MWIIPIEDLIVHGSLRAQPCLTFIPANQNNHPGPFLFIRSNPYSRSMSRRQSKLSRHMLNDHRVESHRASRRPDRIFPASAGYIGREAVPPSADSVTGAKLQEIGRLSFSYQGGGGAARWLKSSTIRRTRKREHRKIPIGQNTRA